MMHPQPGRAYIRGLLWLPRERFDVGLLKHSLTFIPANTGGPGRPQAIRAWAELPHHIGVPWMTLAQEGIDFNRAGKTILEEIGCPVDDARPTRWEEIDIRSRIVLDAIRPELTVQAEAVEAISSADIECGILQMACAFGKTIVALHAAAQYRRPIVVVVDNKGLQQQWAAEVRRHLLDSRGNPVRVGLVGDGKAQWDAPVVIALVQSLFSRASKIPMSIRRRFGVAIFDECHIMGAPEFSKAAPLFMGKRIGLSATPKRMDGLERLYYLHLGHPVYTYLRQDLRPRFIIYKVRSTPDVYSAEFRANVYQWGSISVPKLFSYLACMTDRTYEIAGIIDQGLRGGRKILVLSQRLYLLEQLERIFPQAGKIVGSTRGAARKEILDKKDLILCELKLGERGLDKPDLDMVVVCEPFRAMRKGELTPSPVFQQIVGRVQRRHPGKRTPLVVFVEDNIGQCLGLMKTVRKMIVHWPEDQGGPFEYTVVSGAAEVTRS